MAVCELFLHFDIWGNCIVRYSVGIYSHKTIKLISLQQAVHRLNKAHTKQVINYSA